MKMTPFPLALNYCKICGKPKSDNFTENDKCPYCGCYGFVEWHNTDEPEVKKAIKKQIEWLKEAE